MMNQQYHPYAGNGEIIAGPKNHIWVIVDRVGSNFYARIYEGNVVFMERSFSGAVAQEDANAMARRMLDLLRKHNWTLPR